MTQGQINQLEFAQGLQDFLVFIQDEGRDAMDLLMASYRHISIAVNSDSGGFATVYYMDGQGLQKIIDKAGISAAYKAMTSLGVRVSATMPNSTPCTPREVYVEAIQAGIKPTEFISWLRGKLDTIAAAAPRRVF